VLLLRRLWSEPLVNFAGSWHTIPDAGINPLPVQQPIPLWFGGFAEAAIRRAARLGDGWMIMHRSPAEAWPDLDRLDQFLAEAGRTRRDFGLEPRISYASGDARAWETAVTGWQDIGASHLSFNTMNAGLKTPQEHIRAIREFAGVVLK
jgi:alkanesulfonate monooxygenase SsuD/methylene tetrahydromethanopterin reductase-like flavin-dependent oxidoreductase (luciferase family)